MENKRYNNVEEWANTLSHGAGILLGVIAGYFLLSKAAASTEPDWAVACVSVYLFGMLSSYVSSTWYHGNHPGRLKELLRKFDHGAIYLHIAGTYTPFTLLVMRHAGGWGWGIFSFVWLSAIVGFILSFKKLKEHSNLETVCYVAMGASILVAMKPLMDNLTEMGAAPVHACHLPSVLSGRKHRTYDSDLVDIVSYSRSSFNTKISSTGTPK